MPYGRVRIASFARVRLLRHALRFLYWVWEKKRTVLQSNPIGASSFTNHVIILSRARFRRRTFHEPNLIHWIKYMKSSASESIRNACFNLERLSRSFRLARPGISALDRFWKILTTYFVSNSTEINIFLLLNLVRLELRSASHIPSL